MQLGIFGGSFDPVHLGHLRVAEACRDAVPLDLVLFVPAAAQPLKPTGPQASAEDRLRMLELAVSESDRFAVSDLEIMRGGISYTADTLRQLAEARPGDRLYLILGSDAVSDLSSWREPETICRLATLLVVERPGPSGESAEFLPPRGEAEGRLPLELIRVPLEPVDVSSSDIRRRLVSGKPIDGLVPPAVAAYIEERGLYGP